MSPSQRKLEELLSKQKEVNDQLNMAEDDVAQVNDMLPMLHDSKEVSVQHVLQTCLQHLQTAVVAVLDQGALHCVQESNPGLSNTAPDHPPSLTVDVTILSPP